MSYYDDENITRGDIVAVRHGTTDRRETYRGLVVGSHFDRYGRHIIEVQLDSEVRHVPYPQVTRIRRTISYPSPSVPGKVRTIEHRILW